LESPAAFHNRKILLREAQDVFCANDLLVPAAGCRSGRAADFSDFNP
jgi:hypothetical protein